MKLSRIVECKLCKDQSFSLTTAQTKTATNLHKNACGESSVATLLLTEDSIKNFLREFYTNSFRRITLATLIMLLRNVVLSEKIRRGRGWLLLLSRFGKSSIFLKAISGRILSRTQQSRSVLGN